MTVAAIKVRDMGIPEGQAPGAYEIAVYGGWHPEKAGKPAGMSFRCPCGCGREGYLPFRPAESPSWEFNGNADKPTLKPSVLQVGGCQWHGWLTDGVWRSC